MRHPQGEGCIDTSAGGKTMAGRLNAQTSKEL
jgi:hypothetical protein